MNARPISSMARDLERARRGGAFSDAERDAAARIVAAVRRDGDAAVLRTVRRFDRTRATARELVADAFDLRRAARGCPRDLRAALGVAYSRIRAFHERQLPREILRHDAYGDVRLVPAPLDRVGALVPRGVSAYPSTALMTGVPAQIAGVREIVAASPMPRDGALDPAFAYALTLVGAAALYRAGGAAAVAALAYGTNSVARVDRIVGPGNAYAAAAKWLVSADVGIDALQGPSELIAIASAGADPRALALDLLAQAEHGADAFAVLISDTPTLLRDVAAALGKTSPRVLLYRAPDLLAAARAADSAAPEHVLLAGRRASRLADRIHHAGAVFVGASSAVAFGDYVAGTNHALPTGGTARWSSALRVEDFVRWTSRVELRGGLSRLARAGIAIARHEGMNYHAASMEARA
ncbi:MAG TPA: histidinol dehydrogenase [Candidatus Limnocylindria bacterium]|nr:histidinol dehydrogenase [Candidatus Limnocylindria bacterium]